jgi:hypothetical protein
MTANSSAGATHVDVNLLRYCYEPATLDSEAQIIAPQLPGAVGRLPGRCPTVMR